MRVVREALVQVAQQAQPFAGLVALQQGLGQPFADQRILGQIVRLELARVEQRKGALRRIQPRRQRQVVFEMAQAALASAEAE